MVAAAVRIVLGLTIGIAVACGCGRRAADTPKTEPEPEAPKAPETILGLDESVRNLGASDKAIAGKYDRFQESAYCVDQTYPKGTLVGECRFRVPSGMTLVLPKKETLILEGQNAIKDPRPGEEKLYQTMDIKASPLAGQFGARFYVVNAVVALKNVQVGPVAPLLRPILMVQDGRFRSADRSRSKDVVVVCPQHDRVELTTWDDFSCDMVMKRTGQPEPIFKATLEYLKTADRKAKGFDETDPNKVLYEAVRVSSPTLRDSGAYEIQCLRHPWQKTYVYVTDNPYAVVTTAPGAKRPYFKMENVPAGRHAVEAWHPQFEPAQKSVEVEIKKDEESEVVIEFIPPQAWCSAKPGTEQPNSNDGQQQGQEKQKKHGKEGKK